MDPTFSGMTQCLPTIPDHFQNHCISGTALYILNMTYIIKSYMYSCVSVWCQWQFKSPAGLSSFRFTWWHTQKPPFCLVPVTGLNNLAEYASESTLFFFSHYKIRSAAWIQLEVLGNVTKFGVVTELLKKELDIGEIKHEVW